MRNDTQPESATLSMKILSAFPRFNSFGFSCFIRYLGGGGMWNASTERSHPFFHRRSNLFINALESVEKLPKKATSLMFVERRINSSSDVFYNKQTRLQHVRSGTLYARSNYRGSCNRFCIAIRNVSLFKLNIKRSRFKTLSFEGNRV